MREPTFIPAIGVSAFMVVEFLGGHVFGSICAPIASPDPAPAPLVVGTLSLVLLGSGRCWPP
jgi:hypothetical protein